MTVEDWNVRWRALLERPDPHVTRRVHQGREFQRAGRVTDLRVGSGRAAARVQDARAMPVPVELVLPQLEEREWTEVVRVLAGRVRHSARLLAGHSPDSLDEELVGDGVRVFPEASELGLSCDCFDEFVPCAHAAALVEELGDALESDPFVLFQLRGRGRERLLAELADARRHRTSGARRPGLDLATLDGKRWTSARGSVTDVALPAGTRPSTPAGPLKLLGDPPGWAGGLDAWSLLHPLVEGAATWITECRADGPTDPGAAVAAEG